MRLTCTVIANDQNALVVDRVIERYAWTFAKTEAKPGESPRDAAVRAVREKTGYDAEIRISIPGAFKGSSSSTCYYVMDAKHPPAKPNWQTAALRWVNFDEARDLIRQSPNAEGRDRDLAILDAAEKSADKIAYNEHPNVQPEDWQELKAMPERQTVLYPNSTSWRTRTSFGSGSPDFCRRIAC